MITRRTMIASGSAGLLLPTTAASTAAPAAGLASRARARGITYGTATSVYELNDPSFIPALKREAVLLVPEYEMKRGKLEAEKGKIDFSAVDTILRFADTNGMRMRGHTLVWHKINPAWLENAVLTTRDEKFLTAYITAVMTHYRGRLHSMDVVNEALVTSSTRHDGLRESFWLKAFGPSYIDLSYHAARAADPDCLLVYNDWGCEMAGADNDRMRAITLEFLQGALARRVPIGAYGMQGHLAAFGQPLDQRKLRTFLESLRAMGLRILITELDVYDTPETKDVAALDRAVADTTARFFDVVLDVSDTVLTWGLSDKFLDPPTWRQRLAGYAPRMLPLDSAMIRKPMWQAMATAFDRTNAALALRPGPLR